MINGITWYWPCIYSESHIAKLKIRALENSIWMPSCLMLRLWDPCYLNKSRCPSPQGFLFFLYCFNTLYICTYVIWTLQQCGGILIHFFMPTEKKELIWFIMRRKIENERIVSKLSLKREMTIPCNFRFPPYFSYFNNLPVF